MSWASAVAGEGMAYCLAVRVWRSTEHWRFSSASRIAAGESRRFF